MLNLKSPIILLNYQNYPSWNPFLVKFAKYTNKEDPELKVGDELQIDLKLKGFNHTSTMYPKSCKIMKMD